MKIIFILLAGCSIPIETLADSVFETTLLAKISNQTWYDPMQGCRKVASTKKLIPLIKIDAVKFGYTNCMIHETTYPGGRGLHRNCDQIEGYALFGSSKKYCRWLERPFIDKKK